MQPQLAVVMAHFLTFLACYWADLALPMPLSYVANRFVAEYGVNPRPGDGLSMLLAAIIWNLGTWFFGLPPPVRTP